MMKNIGKLDYSVLKSADIRIFKSARIYLTACLLIFFIAACLVGCGSRQAEYLITVTGSPEESGVIEYAGLEMNVYQNPASNPCGDCPDQPISIYVGTDAADTASAMAKAVERADDLWEVVSCDDGKITLREKKDINITEEPPLSAPKGLELKGMFKG